MESWLVLFGAIAIWLLIQLLAKSNTRVGRAFRESDHQAWRYALEDKQREIDELRQVEPKRG